MTPNRSLLLVAAGILGVVALATFVVLARPGAVPVTPGTPEAALRDYLAAWEAGDYDRAYAALSTEVHDSVTLAEYRQASEWGAGPYGGRRATYVDRVVGDGDRVRVELTVEEYYGDGLDAGSFRSARSIPLVREGGTWKIDEALVWLDPGPFQLRPRN